MVYFFDSLGAAAAGRAPSRRAFERGRRWPREAPGGAWRPARGPPLGRAGGVAGYVFEEGGGRGPELALDLLPAAGGGQLGLTVTY